jgi:acetoin utilization deacetylase AcuC-like enzyme
LRVVYSPRYQIDLGPHVFPTLKYRHVQAQLVESRLLSPSHIVEPALASWEELALVHTPEYLANVRHGTLTPSDLATLELPWSSDMVEGFRTMVGGTITTALIACGFDHGPQTPHPSAGEERSRDATKALNSAIACHIGGGLHHAFANHGEGFCLFNDVAVAVRILQARGLDRIAIVDLDVHHGNGTAFIFESEPEVFTFSMHQQYNYPMWKPRSSLDIGLADGVHDASYLRHLEEALPKVMGSDPKCVFYLAGADPYEDDQLGGLRLTKDGLRRRDRMVIEAVWRARVPLVITLAGGYARRLEDTVEIHVATIEEAKAAEATGPGLQPPSPSL